MKLEQHLSASQYMQCLVSTLGTKQLRLCQQPAQQKPTVAAFCVDHQLRPESSHECQQAANQASAMGLESHVMQMQWPQLPASGHLMEQASIMRYQLLQQACKAHHISVLLTGHHAGMLQQSKGHCLRGRHQDSTSMLPSIMAVAQGALKHRTLCILSSGLFKERCIMLENENPVIR